LKEAAVFPFGWIRGVNDENWQILWNPLTGVIYVKGAISKKIVKLGKSSTWSGAKAFAQMAQNDPEVYEKSIKNIWVGA